MQPLIIPFFIPHAGCPHTCRFCNQALLAGAAKGTLPDAAQIRATVQTWRERSPGRAAEVAFFGGSFTLLPEDDQRRLLEAVQPLIERDELSGIRISTRPDGLAPDRLELLRRYRVKTVEIGVQSLDEQVLQSVQRGHTAAESLAAIARTRQAGFRVGAQLLPGLPGDSADGALASLQGVINAGAQFVRIYPVLALRDTPLGRQYLQGEWLPWGLDEAVRCCARMLHAALRKAVSVIRIGLQNDEGLMDGTTVLAGPWHPAFGQLTRGELYYALVCKLAQQADGALQVIGHPQRLSDLNGHGGRNAVRWQRIGLVIERFATDQSLHIDEVVVQTCRQRLRGSIVTSLNDKEIKDA